MRVLKKRAICLVLLPVAAMQLGGCATTSFAPPSVTTSTKIAEYGGEGCQARDATFNRRSVPIEPNVIGAIDLMNNFIAAYSCAETELADGRQVFQVPSFLAAAVGLAGAQFGLSADGVLATGVFSTVLNAGNSYYVPQEKAGMVSAATRALLCIKSEAVGISFFRTSEESQGDDGDDNEALVRTLTELQEARDDLAANLVDLESMPSGQKSLAMAASEQRMKNNLLEMDNSIAETLLTQALVEQSTGTVSIDAQRQYFEMVGAALFSVQSILGERLRNAGSADTSGIFEELKRLASESEEKDEEAEMADDAADNAEEQATNTNKSLVATPAARAQARAAAVAARQEAIELENEALQPKLQSCVLMARTG